MTNFSIRQVAAAGAAAVAALALAACTPPNENPSDVKIDTATEYSGPVGTPTAEAAAEETTEATTPATGTAAAGAQAGAEAPGFIDCVAAPVEEPTTITLNCADGSDQLINIEWTEWDEESAVGTATRQSPEGAQEDVDVLLSLPTTSPQGLVFTQITVDGVLVTP